MADHNDFGKIGEELAVKYLKRKGFTILSRNWHFGKLELDIIAQHSDKIIFVEVKARTGNVFGNPEEFVTRTKQKHLVKAAAAYMDEKEIDLEARFDIVSVILAAGNEKIDHIEDAFYPTL